MCQVGLAFTICTSRLDTLFICKVYQTSMSKFKCETIIFACNLSDQSSEKGCLVLFVATLETPKNSRNSENLKELVLISTTCPKIAKCQKKPFWYSKLYMYLILLVKLSTFVEAKVEIEF